MAKRVYTEDDVRRLPAGCELRLGPEALATPSALDAARARGIRVVYAGDGEAADGADAAVGGVADLARLAAADGAYHVEVRGGRVRVWRLG